WLLEGEARSLDASPAAKFSTSARVAQQGGTSDDVTITAVDLNEPMIERGKLRAGIERVNWQPADAMKLPERVSVRRGFGTGCSGDHRHDHGRKRGCYGPRLGRRRLNAAVSSDPWTHRSIAYLRIADGA